MRARARLLAATSASRRNMSTLHEERGRMDQSGEGGGIHCESGVRKWKIDLIMEYFKRMAERRCAWPVLSCNHVTARGEGRGRSPFGNRNYLQLATERGKRGMETERRRENDEKAGRESTSKLVGGGGRDSLDSCTCCPPCPCADQGREFRKGMRPMLWAPWGSWRGDLRRE